MKLEEYFESIGLDDVENFIKDKKEEDVNLEFKTVVHPNENDKNKNDDKKNFSKALSGFANSNGGILIWGVEARPGKDGVDVAKKLKPVEKVRRFLNKLNSLEGQAVTPMIEGVKHKLISINEADDEGIIKTYIPKSDRAPHMANYADKHYYKRSGDSFYRAEHYDIEDMFSRKRRTELTVELIRPDIRKVSDKKYRIEVIVAIKNVGPTIGKYPFLAFSVNDPYFSWKFGLDGNGFTGLQKVISNTTYRNNFSGGQQIVIYPKVEHEVTKIIMELANPSDKIPDLVMDYQLVAENMGIKEDRIVYPMNGVKSKYMTI